MKRATDWRSSSAIRLSSRTCSAAALGLDFALLSAVLPTASHPQSDGIGWNNFSRLIERAPLPVFALGGMRAEMLETARLNGAHGIALMRGWG